MILAASSCAAGRLPAEKKATSPRRSGAFAEALWRLSDLLLRLCRAQGKPVRIVARHIRGGHRLDARQLKLRIQPASLPPAAVSDGAGRKSLSRSVGNLINPLGALRAVVEGLVDVAPVDSFCHDLFRAAAHPYTLQTRTVAVTDRSPIPALVASANVPLATADRIRGALLSAHLEPTLEPYMQKALIRQFQPIQLDAYDYTAAIAKAADRAGYTMPA